MNPDWWKHPATEHQKEKLRFFGCTWDEGITARQASDALEECARQFPSKQIEVEKWFQQLEDAKIQAEWSKNRNAVEAQEKSPPDVAVQKMETVAKLPDTAAAVPVFIPPTPEQLSELASFGKVPPVGLTFAEANIWIEQCIILHPAKLSSESSQEATTKKAETPAGQPSRRHEGFFYGTTESIKSRWQSLPEVTIQEAVKPQNPSPSEYAIPTQPQASVEPKKTPTGIELQIAQLSDSDAYVRKSAATALGQSQDSRAVRPLMFSSMSDTYWCVRVQAAQSLGVLKNPDAVQALIVVLLRDSEFEVRSTAADALGQITDTRSIDALTEALKDPNRTVRQAATNALARIREKNRSHIVQNIAPRQRAGRKPAAGKLATSIEWFSKELDGLLKRNQTCTGGHWLPAGPLQYIFSADVLSIGLCRQIADMIESKGYCVEPDARFGSGTYDRNQTLALFKPLEGDSTQPSTAYIGAANLLRLCVLVATADGRIDVGELDVFRQAIESQTDLSQTDHKRLIILEQLLTQELCSASKAVARIAKSVSANKRSVIGKLLVDVATANKVVTQGERRVLERVFNAFEIPPTTLEWFIDQARPSYPRQEVVHADISKQDKWLWNHWRTGHPGVVIDDFTLAQKRWNFNDWKALNRRWRTLHERLNARQEQSGKASSVSTKEAGTDSSDQRIPKRGSGAYGFCKCCSKENARMSRSSSGDVRSYCVDCEGEIKQRVFDQRLNRWVKPSTEQMPGASGKQIPEPVVGLAPKDFALDMARVYEIANETREVVGILSVLMEDEPEKPITLPKSLVEPVPEIQKDSNDGKAAFQPTRFNGLDAAFHPILERLLARDSWPRIDFNALASEFHFMPLNIHDTLNEWADEVLGDFILDGEDPVVIRRELIEKRND